MGLDNGFMPVVEERFGVVSSGNNRKRKFDYIRV